MQLQAVAKDRRMERRLALSHPVNIKPCEPKYPAEDCVTLNVSGNGLYFTTPIGHYFTGMEVWVTRDVDSPIRQGAGWVVQVDKLKNGRWGVAVQILAAEGRRMDRPRIMVVASGLG